MSDNDELQDLREQTDVGTRIEESESMERTLEDAMVDILEDVTDGSRSSTLSMRDERLAALVQALEEMDTLDDVGATLQEALGQEAEPDEIDRSELLRLAVRVGLSEAAPEVLESAREGYARHASQDF